jgi:hypothetical protein
MISAAECLPPTVHLGLRDFTRLNQRRDTCVGQFVAMPVHAVFQTSGFEPPLVAEPTIIVRAMPYLVTISLRRAGSTNDQSKGDKQSHAIARHGRVLPFFLG